MKQTLKNLVAILALTILFGTIGVQSAYAVVPPVILDGETHTVTIDETIFNLTIEQGGTLVVESGVTLMPNTTLLDVESDQVRLHDSVAGRNIEYNNDGVVMVTSRTPEDTLFYDIQNALSSASDTMLQSLSRIGDCQAPGIIATAVYEGHRYARELGEEIDPVDVPFRRERIVIEPSSA